MKWATEHGHLSQLVLSAHFDTISEYTGSTSIKNNVADEILCSDKCLSWHAGGVNFLPPIQFTSERNCTSPRYLGIGECTKATDTKLKNIPATN